MAVAQRMSEAKYERFVLTGAEGLWELHDRVLVKKPGMSWEHLNIKSLLVHLLQDQLDPSDNRVFIEGRVRRPTDTIFLPDMMVVHISFGDPFRGKPGTLAIFPGPSRS